MNDRELDPAECQFARFVGAVARLLNREQIEQCIQEARMHIGQRPDEYCVQVVDRVLCDFSVLRIIEGRVRAEAGADRSEAVQMKEVARGAVQILFQAQRSAEDFVDQLKAIGAKEQLWGPLKKLGR